MMRSQQIRALFAAIAFAVAAVGVIIAFAATRERVAAPSAYLGTPVTPPKAAADFTLTDQRGMPAHLFDASASSTFLFFGYTHCPDACPLALAALGRAYRTLTPATAAVTRIVFVTVDPERDTPPVMKRYANAFDPHILALTGSEAQLAPVWNAYGVTIDRATKELAHGDAIYAIDSSQHVVLIYPSNTKASDVANDATIFAKR